MAVVTFTGVLLVVSLCGISQAYFPYHPTCYASGPRYEACRDSIEDLKALVEVTQSLKDNGYSCPTCANTFSEELILKLVNALIFTATYNCGQNGGGHGGGNGGGNGGGHGGGNGGGHGGGNGGGHGGGNGGSHGGGNGGGHGGGHGVHCPGGSCIENPWGGHPGGGKKGKSDGGLIDLGILDGEDTVGLSVGNTKVLEVDVGPQSDSGGKGHSGSKGHGGGKNSDEGLINVGVLNKGNSLLNVGLGGTDLLNIDLGKDHSHGESSGSKKPVRSGHLPAGGSGPVSESTTSPVPITGTPPIAQGSGINPDDSNNQGGITSPANDGDVTQINQAVTQVTNNIIPSH